MKRKLRTYCCGPKCDATGSQRLEMPTSRSMELRHWRASVPWSIPAELLKILSFQAEEPTNRTSTELGTKHHVKEANTPHHR